MYKVILDNNNVKYELHSLTSDKSVSKLKSGTINIGINSIPSLEFIVLPNNSCFNLITPFISKIIVINTKTNKEVFEGRVLKVDPKMDSKGAISKNVVCEGQLAYLCDSKQPYTKEKVWKTDDDSTGLFKYISYLLDNHNKQVEPYKQIFPGIITGPTLTNDDSVYKGTNYENTFDIIKSKIVDDFGGEINLRKVNDKLFLDYVYQIGEEKNTSIEVAKNMKSIDKSSDYAGTFTRLIPLGAKLKVKDDSGNEVESEERLTIASVNNGCIWLDTELVNDLGIITKTIEFNDITVASNLLAKGREYLTEDNYGTEKHTISVVDLSLIDDNEEEFEVGNYYPVKNKLLDIDKKLRVIKKTIDICTPVKSTLTFGDNKALLSDITKRKMQDIEAILQQINFITSNFVKNEALVNTYTNTLSIIEQKYNQISLTLQKDYVTNSEYANSLSQLADITVLIDDISLKVSQFTNQSEAIANIQLDLTKIKSDIGSITDVTSSSNGIGMITINNVLFSDILHLQIYPTQEDISYLYPSNDLFPNNDVYPLSRDIVFEDEEEGTKVIYTLPCDLLYLNDNVKDEFILDYDTNSLYVIHRVGLNETGNKYELEESQIEYFDYENISLPDGNYTIRMPSFNTVYINIRALAKNLYTSQYATKVQLETSLELTKTSILGTVEEKITLVNGKVQENSALLEAHSTDIALRLKSSDFTKDAVIGLINNKDGTSTALIEATNIDLTGYVSVSDIASSGKTTINGSNITTGTISANRLDSKVITTDNFSAQNINASKIVSGTLDASRVNVTNLNASNIVSGTLSCDRLSGGTISGQSISGGSIYGASLSGMSGSIGGWVIASNRLYSNNSRVASSMYSNGNVIFGGNYGMIKFDTNPVRITTADKLLICDSYSESLMSSSGDTISIRAFSGTIHVNSNFGVYANNQMLSSSSSRKTKKNIKSLTNEELKTLIDEIGSLKFYSYDYKKKYSGGQKCNYGFMIDDIENTNLSKLLHVTVIDDKDKDVKNYNKEDLTVLNTILIQELLKKIKNIEREMTSNE